jgi:hypothetical protein
MSLETVGLVCLLVGAVVTEIRRALEHGEFSMPKASPRAWGKRLLSVSPTLLMLGGFALYLETQWSASRGFEPNWPDAIRCDSQLPDQTTDRKSPLIYTFNGLRFSRRNIGDVAGYSVAGSYNKDGKYSPHEIWFFIANAKMVTADQLRSTGNLDGVEKFYVDWFPNADCGGADMPSIMKAGRAYWFAQKLH